MLPERSLSHLPKRKFKLNQAGISSQIIPIAYHGGTYGTYLEWCLYSLTSTDQLVSPFTKVGNSHNFKEGNYLEFDAVSGFLNTNQSAKFARFHPKTKQQHSISARLDQVCDLAQHMIYIYPDRNSVLLTINHWFSKMSSCWWTDKFSITTDANKLYQFWPVEPGTAIQDIAIWIRREFLSFYFMPAWHNQVEWYHPDHWQNPNCCVITVRELLNHFEETLQKIRVFCGIEYVRPVQDLLPFHEQNLKNQKYLHHDRVCADIIRAVTDNQDFSWESLSLPSEAWIQWQLRNLGYEIQCHGLDKFPTNSVHLHELLIKTNTDFHTMNTTHKGVNE